MVESFMICLVVKNKTASILFTWKRLLNCGHIPSASALDIILQSGSLELRFERMV